MKKTRGIYLHIPFCTGKCFYCDFYSVSGNPNDIFSYTAALKREIAAAACFTEKATTDTLYFGGGTPSLLSPAEIADIIETVRKHHDFSAAEITVEANPEPQLDFKGLKAAGVNRISFGVQSFSDEVLKTAGRRHTAREAEIALEKAAKVFDNISVDIMLGLPGDAPEAAAASAVRAAGFSKHISMYMLKLEPGTAMYEGVKTGKINLPDEDVAVDSYDACMEELLKRGFHRYEISNFSLPGFESRHNQKYWDRSEYFGFGAAAHGFIAGKRYFNPSSIARYLAGENYGAGRAEEEVISSEEAAKEAIILALRTEKGLYIPEFEEEFDCNFRLRYAEELKNAASFAEQNGDYFRMKHDKLLFESAVARLFI